MNKLYLILVSIRCTYLTTFSFIVVLFPCFSISQTPGYFKDLFMDGGCYLTSKTSLPSSNYLNLTMEFMATSDSVLQRDIILGNFNDANGALLYPDGEPRFKCIYTNGGSATKHGRSLGTEGRERIKQFFYSGGSYTGSCAGAFIVSHHYLPYSSSQSFNPSYYHLWPARTRSTGLNDTTTGHFIPSGSPLLQYSSFGNDFYIDDIYHNGGGYIRDTIPIGTEILLTYDFPGWLMHNKVSSWAYKVNDTTGRLVVIISHPEGKVSGEGLDLMAGILQYALEGVGDTYIKHELFNNIPVIMNKSTEDSIPEFTKIGDKQYHHFLVQIPSSVDTFHIKLDGESLYDFNLYLNYNDFAFIDQNTQMDISLGSSKEFSIINPLAGDYYIGVECATTVLGYAQNGYIGQTSILNGASYSINARWSSNTGISDYNLNNCRRLIKIVDALGREITDVHNHKDQVLFYIYNDSTVEKIIKSSTP